MSIKILIVDDDIDLLRMMYRTLEREGFQVETAENGMEALARIQKAPPDIVISDIRMPICDGIELMTTLTRSAHAKIPILLTSGYTGVDEGLFKTNPNYAGFIAKPVKRHELITFVQSLTNNHEP